MVIFHSYVSLPEGKTNIVYIRIYMYIYIYMMLAGYIINRFIHIPNCGFSL